MMEVVVGVVLTAVIGGLLVPAVQAHMYQRRERLRMSGELLETLAACLWTYWKLALRVAYYPKKGSTFKDDYATALTAWDSAEAWDNGARIQIQISRSKRLLPEDIHKKLDQLQQQVVDDLDKWVEDLREGGDAAKWENLYECLYGPKRAKIQRLLFSLTQDLARARAQERPWLIRWWPREDSGETVAHMDLATKPDEDCPPPAVRRAGGPGEESAQGTAALADR